MTAPLATAGAALALAPRAAEEIRSAVAGIEPGQLDALAGAIAGASRIVLYGVGREGLMMRALAMRLYHLGLAAHVAGDMACPPVGAGDLLLVSAGPGGFSTVEALLDVARAAGARTACVTAEPGGPAPARADLVLAIPAQTMARDVGGASVLPMGSLFEGAQFLAFEILVLLLRDRLGETAESMRARHTNLE
ncbi:SIS domain-containing protein [Rubellimicrobium sp. CFH 75288]|uniref:SIS domain-containing protein n=1 Tax=Rubellimicrobium sp. CFH 75288 TaxID=2697034 RepID=UPI0014133DF2|nr:SIS domain-containing protein [Rubellimicrobium sp. CFH 75288]NAZ36095.1 SIS domain-containing protein [Rubellimicrobium sp. CFH 75288]